MNTMIEPKTLKGFRDFLPEQARKRQYVINTLKGVFESYGFEPLETPALEYEEILAGKYGDEGDKLMYRFEDNGGRKVALRYDQTVPLARVVAQYGSASTPQGQPLLPMPFKRYQIQPVWRAENTQKGRFREFVQCDIDTVGTGSLFADAEIIFCAAKSLGKLGFKKFKILINDRQIFSDIPSQAILVIDKLKKIGRDGVIQELVDKKLCSNTKDAAELVEKIENAKLTENLKWVFIFLKEQGLSEDQFEFAPTLARGLDYYTDTIFEIEIEGYSAGSVCGGGRYDKLVGMFAGRDIAAVGCAFGFDRVIDAMEELRLFPDELTTTQVLVTLFSQQLASLSLKTALQLREVGINTEISLDLHLKMEKQLKYADSKKIPFVVIIGPDEAKNKMVTVKDLKTRDQKTIPLEDLVQMLQNK